MPSAPVSGRLPLRFAISSVTLAACFLLSSGRLVFDAHHLKNSTDNIAQRSDQRFRELKATLPARGVVGYVGEPGPLALGDYYLAQYALAPLVVEHSPDHPLVIGNFPATSSATPADLQLVKDFGGGVLLFQNKFIPKGNQ
jgi:hypothetical protein